MDSRTNRWLRSLSSALPVLLLLLAASQSGYSAEQPLELRRFDLLLCGGTVVDGSGDARYTADVGVIADQVAAIGNLSQATAERTLDVSGKIVAPGFIDLHAHIADGEYGEKGLLSSDPRRRAAQNYVAQGVTTAVGNPDGSQPPALKEQREKLTALGIGLNVALTNGHNGLRARVMGNDQERPANPEEIRQMQRILQHDLAHEGSFGLSLGTEYFSGRYSTTGEQVALAHVLPPYNGIFIPHMRSQGIAPMWYLPSIHEGEPPTWTDAVDEVLAVAERTGATVVITHMKAWGPGFRNRAEEMIARLQAARDRGARLYIDVYPYTSSGSDGRFVGIPDWAFDGVDDGMDDTEDAGPSTDYRAALARTLDGADRGRLDDLERDIRHTVRLKGGAENIFVLDYPDEDVVGRRLSEVMNERGLDVVEMILTFQREGNRHLPGGARLRAFSMADEDIQTFYRQPWAATSTDGWIVLPEALNEENKYVGTHRRAFGSFPRRIAYYSQEKGVDSLERAIRSMTGLPAGILSLANRGRLAVGMKADIVVFDLDDLKDTTTYLEPSAYPEGIEHVLVNGEFVVDGGRRTLALAGRVLMPGGRLRPQVH